MQLSIVIPTFSRLDALRDCLKSILTQTGVDFGGIEVLVLNDGGDEAAGRVCETILGSAADGPTWRYLHRDHAGPAAVRNAAAREAKGDLLLILNDDVTLEPGHLAAHLAFHARHGTIERANDAGPTPPPRTSPSAPPVMIAAKGMTEWAPASVTTPLMRWLARQSFTYFLIEDPHDIGYEYYHTSDISIPRRVVTEFAPFDEAFLHPGFEDTEWGCRIEARGWKLGLLPAARTHHHHVYDEAALAKRAWANGYCAAFLFERVPRLRGRAIDDFIRPDEIPYKIPGLPRGLRRFYWNRRNRHDAAVGRLNRIWGAAPIEERPGPKRWAELARRNHVEGFTSGYWEIAGLPYPG